MIVLRNIHKAQINNKSAQLENKKALKCSFFPRITKPASANNLSVFVPTENSQTDEEGIMQRCEQECNVSQTREDQIKPNVFFFSSLDLQLTFELKLNDLTPFK